MNGVVYKICNIVNNKCYIGSTCHHRGFTHRWSQHKRALFKNKHHSLYLQRAWNKYGESSFVFEILLYCDPTNCLMYEQLAMDYYQSAYNIAQVAGSPIGTKHTKQSKLNMSLAHRGKYEGIKNPAAKLNDQDVVKIRKMFNAGVNRNQIADRFSISRTHIYRIANKANWSHVL